MKEHFFEERGLAYRTNELVPGRLTLVFVHGVSGSSSAWTPYEEALQNDFNIVTYDQRGHGHSKRYLHYNDYRLGNCADDLHALLRHLGDHPYVIIGHSFGAIVVLRYLMEWHHRIKGAVLISGDYNVGRHVVVKVINVLLAPALLLSYLPFGVNKKGRVDYVARFKNTGDWNIHRSLTDIWNTGIRIYLFCIRQSYHLDATEVLPTMKLPVLVMHGTKDTIFGIENSQEMARRIPNATFVPIKDADHILVLNIPDIVTQKIRAFLSTIA
jgi:pimeloyl-ACP methyl ester carboxylesterase